MALDTTVVNIDFEILPANSCKVLKVLDLSHWASSQDSPAYIEITTPGLTVPVVHMFKKDALNIFNIVNLGLSDVTDYSNLTAIPDGIYTIAVLRCANDAYGMTKYHFQDCQIRCSIIRKLIALDLNCAPCRVTLIKKLQDVLLFLEAAKAQTARCNPLKAMELYRRAELILSRITSTGETTEPCLNC